MGNAVTTAIITGGLTCNPSGTACQNGIITTFFDLYCSDVVVPPVVGSGGGHYPRDAWNKFNAGDIQNFYKVLPDDQQYYIVPKDQEAEYFRRHKIIKLHFRIGERKAVKEISIPEKRARAVVKALNVLNATYQNIKVVVSNIQKLASTAAVAVKKVRRGK